MSEKKGIGCVAYAVFSIAMVALAIALFVLYVTERVSFAWLYLIAVPIIIWIIISAIISKKQRASLPIIQSQADVCEKTQDNTRYGSLYFLTFVLEDGSKKTFKVTLNTYAQISINEKGLLKYKQLDKKREHWLSYLFIGFDKE